MVGDGLLSPGAAVVVEGATGAPVALLGQVPLDMQLREGGDTGHPVVVADPDSPAATAMRPTGPPRIPQSAC